MKGSVELCVYEYRESCGSHWVGDYGCVCGGVCVCVCVCSVASEVKPVAGRAALSHWVKVEVHLCT